MNCTQCGREIPDDAALCPYCGTKVGEPTKPKKKRRRTRLFIAGAALVVIIICLVAIFSGGDEATEPPAEAPTQIAVQEQETTALTSTPKPTVTPPPTSTPEPTDTPKPTNTPEPTATPTPLPEPQLISGSGTSVVDLDDWGCDPVIIHITGNAASRHFAVTSYDAAGEQIDLLVNTTDPYDGYRPMDWLEAECTVRIQVEGVGDWTIEIAHLLSALESGEHTLLVPGTYEGTGDNVILLWGEDPDLAIITGNAGARYFGVFSWGNRKDILVNTTDPYEGSVIVAKDTAALEIKAEGDWTIEVTD